MLSLYKPHLSLAPHFLFMMAPLIDKFFATFSISPSQDLTSPSQWTSYLSSCMLSLNVTRVLPSVSFVILIVLVNLASLFVQTLHFPSTISPMLIGLVTMMIKLLPVPTWSFLVLLQYLGLPKSSVLLLVPPLRQNIGPLLLLQQSWCGSAPFYLSFMFRFRLFLSSIVTILGLPISTQILCFTLIWNTLSLIFTLFMIWSRTLHFGSLMLLRLINWLMSWLNLSLALIWSSLWTRFDSLPVLHLEGVYWT